MMVRQAEGGKAVVQHIDPDTVNAVFLDCLFRPEEIVDGKPPKDAVIVEGVMHKVGFNRERLGSHREQVREWLRLLPTEFRKTGGGGWTFLNACNQADGEQWTGLHQRMDQLFTLGIGLGIAQWQMPREMWSMFPGGMPYVQIEA
jgi:hypothetical protein